MNYGVVAEFNPFHNGHKYLFDSLKKNSEDTVSVVMSESFVQRGEGAVFSVSSRVRAALSEGADLVLSLPVPYATASAGFFAKGAIEVLHGLGVIDALGFGSECGDEARLAKCADILKTREFSHALEKYLNQGLSFPAARQRAVSDITNSELDGLLSLPNDILAIEYIYALNNLNSPIKPFAVKRKGVEHHGENPVGEMCSASALREMLFSGGDAFKYIPRNAAGIFNEEIQKELAPCNFGGLEKAVLYKLRTMSVKDFSLLPDVGEGLEYRIYEAVRSSKNLSEILEKVKTKRYTHSRIRRIILCAFLDIKKADVIRSVPYIRVLGFNEKGAGLLKVAKEKSALPIVTKPSDFNFLNDDAKALFSLECNARDIFALTAPAGDVCGREMTDKIIVF